ncbi:MAG: hypothetical protein C0392_00415 [Syntrophus sp. (in: bacteria)]|nr:hypothetical protein [Syntrophus sp. (in: bacteria)]
MRFKRILFIYPDYPNNHYGGKNPHPPIGIGYIAELLKKNNIETTLVDMGLQLPSKHLQERIEEFKPDLVAISLMTFRYKHHYALLKDIKSQIDVPIVVGGPHVTALRAKALEQCKNIDFGIFLEGEYTMLELCQGEYLEKIKGLIYRENGVIISNGARILIKELDTLPFPKYQNIDLSRYQDVRYICSSRGCPYNCAFCQSKSMLGKKYRVRSAQNIFDEIIFWYNNGYRDFNFVDDNFTMDRKRVYTLCNLIKQSNMMDLDLSASGVRADQISEDLLKEMKESGFTHLCFGVESASDNVLKALNKKETIGTIEQSVELANRLGFFVRLYFVVGSPYETFEDVKKSIEFAEKYSTGGCNFGSLMPLPDTGLMEWVQENGTLLMEPDYYLNEFAEFERIPYFDGPGMTIEEKMAALEMTEKVRNRLEKIYNINLRKHSLKKYFKRDIKNSGYIKAILFLFMRTLLLNKFLYTLYNKSQLLKRCSSALKGTYNKTKTGD